MGLITLDKSTVVITKILVTWPPITWCHHYTSVGDKSNHWIAAPFASDDWMVGSIQNYKYVLSYNLLITLIFYGNDAMFSSRTHTMILIGTTLLWKKQRRRRRKRELKKKMGLTSKTRTLHVHFSLIFVHFDTYFFIS